MLPYSNYAEADMAFGAHLRSLASLNFQKTSLSWRVVADTVSNLTVEEFEPQTSRTDSDCAIASILTKAALVSSHFKWQKFGCCFMQT